MIRKKVAHKRMKRFIQVAGIIGLLLFFTGSIFAVVLMKVVPQKIGYKDVEYTSFNKKSCTECHSASMAKEHHATKNALSRKCYTCHNPSKKTGNVGVSLERDCMKCHPKSPHHKTEAALNKECTTCHDSPGIDDYTLKGPSYKPSNITPSKDSCKNCHNTSMYPEDNLRENIVCVNCHNVHGSNTQYGALYDDLGYTHTTTANGNTYGAMKPEAYGVGGGAYSLDDYPTYCRNSCHIGNRKTNYMDWIEPYETRAWFDPIPE